MKDLLRLFVSLVIPVFMLAVANPAIAQDKVKDAKAAKAEKGKAITKVLFDNDKVRVQEVTFKPGDELPNVARPFRIIRTLKGGTIQRTHPDGKTDKVVYKTGKVDVFEADKPFVPKNVGKSDIVLYVVALKEPNK